MKAYHCYEQHSTLSEWFEIEILIQLLSILYWKKYCGSISLLANDAHIDLLKHYEILDEYDSIIILNDLDIDKHKYWASSKISCNLQITDKEYCLLDTDAFFRKFPDLTKKYAFTGMHCEHHLLDPKFSVYPDINQFYPSHILNKVSKHFETPPINTSFLHVKDKDFINSWAKYSIEIMKSSPSSTQGEMISVEQHFLPMLAETQNKKYSTIVSNVYLPGHENSGDEWMPNPREGNIGEISKIFFHLWGFKKQLKNQQIRDAVMSTLIHDIEKEFPDKKKFIADKFKTLGAYFNV